MTTFTNTWNSTLPAESEDIRLGAGRIRDFKTDVVERLAVDHSFALTADDGAHKKVTLLEQAADPGTVANTGYVYAKDVAGVTELFWKDSAGTVVQLTTAGVLKGPLSGNADTATKSGIPQNSQSAAYTTVLADANKHLLHPTADNNARTFTIDSNANVAYAIGTTLTFVNQINTLTIAITSDTLTLAGIGTTGSRTLNSSGMATAIKMEATKWVISGSGLS